MVTELCLALLQSKQFFCGPVWANCGSALKFGKLLGQCGAISGCPPHFKNCWANAGPSRYSPQLKILGGPSWGLCGQAHKINARINFESLLTKAPRWPTLYFQLRAIPRWPRIGPTVFKIWGASRYGPALAQQFSKFEG